MLSLWAAQPISHNMWTSCYSSILAICVRGSTLILWTHDNSTWFYLASRIRVVARVTEWRHHVPNLLHHTLHWLPIRQSVQSSKNAFTPWPRCTLRRWANQFPVSLVVAAYTFPNLAIPQTKTSARGPRSFAVSGPTSCNSLPHCSMRKSQQSSYFKAGSKRRCSVWSIRA